MFLSLNRKIVYSIFSLFLGALLLFVLTFYLTYSSKVEKDQLASIQRNQQYSDLMYQVINLNRELKQRFAGQLSRVDPQEYPQLYSVLSDDRQSDFLVRERKNIADRLKSFDDQYRTIEVGVTVILLGALVLGVLILLTGGLIGRWILTPINHISAISEQVSHGNLNLRVAERSNIRFVDELDNLGTTFNTMLDSLQNMMEEIKDKEAFLQALIDSIPDGIRVIDEHHNIVIANNSYYKMAGDTEKREHTCYASSFGCSQPCDEKNMVCPLRLLADHQRKNVATVQQFAADPHRYLGINAAEMIYDTPHRYVVEAIRDLSETINFSHRQKVSSLSFLSSSIAHEIKNQLGALRMIMDHLIGKYYQNMSDESDEKKLMQTVYQELIKAAEIPEHLLKLTRSDANDQVVFDCGEAVADVVQLMDFEAKSKGVQIVFEKPKRTYMILGNNTDFQIAVVNIVLNAIKAMTGQGTLSIQMRASAKDGVQIRFRDTGKGISKENLARIFNPFFSEGQQQNGAGGSGLGLAITKSIVEKSGGHIDVESTLGEGSCFTLCFPENKKLAKK
jgi:two-component system phosphate regulon sensor histidine kinase PhoR